MAIQNRLSCTEYWENQLKTYVTPYKSEEQLRMDMRSVFEHTLFLCNKDVQLEDLTVEEINLIVTIWAKAMRWMGHPDPLNLLITTNPLIERVTPIVL